MRAAVRRPPPRQPRPAQPAPAPPPPPPRPPAQPATQTPAAPAAGAAAAGGAGAYLPYVMAALIVADMTGIMSPEQTAGVENLMAAADAVSNPAPNEGLMDLLREYREQTADYRENLNYVQANLNKVAGGSNNVSFRSINNYDDFLQYDVDHGYMPENSPRKYVQRLNDQRAMEQASKSRQISPLLHNNVINELVQQDMTGSGMCMCKRKCKCKKGGELGFRDEADEATHNFSRAVGRGRPSSSMPLTEAMKERRRKVHEINQGLYFPNGRPSLIRDMAVRPPMNEEERIIRDEIMKQHPSLINERVNPTIPRQRIKGGLGIRMEDWIARPSVQIETPIFTPSYISRNDIIPRNQRPPPPPKKTGGRTPIREPIIIRPR